MSYSKAGLVAGILALVAKGSITQAALDGMAKEKGLAESTAEAVVGAAGIRSQSNAAVLTINLTDGQIDPEQLTELLKVSFPGANVGARHGPHYLSLGRSGKLDGMRAGIVIPERRATGKRAKKDDAPTAPAQPPSLAAAKPAEQPKAVPVPKVEAPSEPAKPAEAPKETLESLLAKGHEPLVILAKALGVKASGKNEQIAKRILALQG